MKKILLFVLVSVSFHMANGQFRNTKSVRPTQTELDYNSPKEYEIADISVSGVKLLDKNALVSLTGLKVGDRIKVPGDAISSAIKKLWKHGLIGDAAIYIEKVEAGKAYLNIELSERPRLTGFYFDGISKSKQSELKDDLDLIKGRVLSDAIIKNAELAIKSHFIGKGFLNTEVKVIQEVDTLNKEGVKLRFVVNPKAKVKVDHITFEGNDNLSDNKLKRKMKSTNEKVRFSLFKSLFNSILGKPKESLGMLASSEEVSSKELQNYINDNVKLNFLKSSKFIEDDYEEDKKSLIDFYNSKGFRDAVVVSDTLYKKSGDEIDVHLKIDEGKKYYFRDIEWTGNYVHTDKTLDAVLGIEKGDVYNMELITKKLTFNPSGTDINGLYMDDGYLFFNVTPVEVAIDGDSIDIEMRVYEGTQATIKKVIIKGNDRTSDHVILRELRTMPGEKFSRSDIIQSTQRLSQLGYFDPEQINPVPLPNPQDGTVDIEWNVVERSSDQIELSGGWGGQFGFIGTVGLVFNNFSLRNVPHIEKWRPLPVGDGQKLQLRAQANGRQFQSYSFSFTEPWLGGKKPNSLTVSLTHSVQRSSSRFNRDGTLNRTFSFTDFNSSLKLTGITLGLGRRLEWPDNWFTLTNSLSFLVYSLDNFNNGGLGFGNGNARNFTFNTTISRNSINQPMYPTSGSSMSLSVALTPPYSLWRDIDYSTASNQELYKWVEYHKWMLDARHYLNLAGKLVLESRAHFGFIGSYSKRAGIGPFERFNLGGDGLAGQNFLLGNDVIGLRGYENNSIVPPNFGLGDTELTQNQIRGGVVYNKFTAELRYPVTTSQAATIYGFVFAEAGNNWNNYEEFNPFNLYKSAGFGARIFMPAFGLIGVNWAYGFDTLPGRSERSGAQFHFTIGQQIR